MALSSCSCEMTEAALRSHAPNMWNFPGGAVEPNEQPIEAAIREIAEEFEINVDPSNCTEIWRYSHEHAAIDHIFLCPTAADTTPVLHEGAAWAWMTLTEIAGLELGFEQAKIVDYMLRIQASGNPIEHDNSDSPASVCVAVTGG